MLLIYILEGIAPKGKCTTQSSVLSVLIVEGLLTARDDRKQSSDSYQARA